jgi:hypothetical protein
MPERAAADRAVAAAGPAAARLEAAVLDHAGQRAIARPEPRA